MSGMPRQRVAIIVGSALIAAACSSSAAVVATEPKLPVGKSFVATSVVAGGKDRPLVAGTKLIVTFGPKDVGLSAGCNDVGWPDRLDHGNLVVEGAPKTTLIACKPALRDQDAWLTAFINGGPAISVSGKTLTLRSATTVITLVETAHPSPS